MELELEEGGAGGAELRRGTSGGGAEPCGGERADVVFFLLPFVSVGNFNRDTKSSFVPGV